MANSFIPLILYHMRLSEPNPLFPATISHSIRKGIPKLVHHIIWLLGWACMLRVIAGNGDILHTIFAIKMVVTGVIAVMIYPVG